MYDVVSKYVPPHEREIFYRLSSEVQDDIKEKLSIYDRVVMSALSVEKAAANEAARFHGKKGRSKEQIKRIVRAMRNEGWQRLENGSKKKVAEKRKLPVDFIEYWKDLCLDHQRGKITACHRELIRRWQEGEEIPGYGNWRTYWSKKEPNTYFDSCPPDLPEGWNERNLRRYKPSTEEMDFAQYGIAAGLKHIPHVIRTRVGLRPLEWIAFDDVETDFMISVPGVEQPVRLAALVCKDVATDMWLRFVLRPVIPRADGTRDGLKAVDMKRLIADLVMYFGYPVDYVMNLVFERGTATLPPDDVRALAEVTSGMVVSHPTTMITGQVLMSGFSDKAIGKARAKGWIESGFNLMHNEYAMLPGQKGLSWQKAPRELENRVKYATSLLEAGAQLSAAEHLKEAIPFIDVFEASKVLYTVLDRINNRKDHKLEGFEPVQCWRLSKGDPWKTIGEAMQYPVEVRNHGMWKPFLESPLQRFCRLVEPEKFERVPDSALRHILADHRTVRVESHQIRIEIDKRTYVFFDRDCPYLFENEATYLAYFDRNKMDYIYLTDGDRSYKCKLPRIDKVRQGDMDAMQKQIADNNRTLGRVIKKINSRDSRVEKTQRKIAGQLKAIETLEQMQGINIAPQTHPETGKAGGVARALTESQLEVQREADAREAELVRVRSSKTRLNDIYRTADPEEEPDEEPASDSAPRLSDLYGSDND